MHGGVGDVLFEDRVRVSEGLTDQKEIYTPDGLLPEASVDNANNGFKLLSS